MSTLVITPVQSKPRPWLDLINFLWRAPAVFLFVIFMGETHVRAWNRLSS